MVPGKEYPHMDLEPRELIGIPGKLSCTIHCGQAAAEHPQPAVIFTLR